ALDGNQATNRQTFSSVLISGLSVPPGQHVFFRWRDIDDSGMDQGMALDDLIISFSPQFPPTDRFWTNALGGNYNVAANWLSNAVPLPQDTANFTNEASYQVDWPLSAITANAIFNAGSGTVTQAIGASSWTIANNYVVGKD